MYGTVLLILLSAIVVVVLTIMRKSRKRVGKTDAEREQQIAAMLASARAEAMNAKLSPLPPAAEHPTTQTQTAASQTFRQREVRYLLEEQQQLLYRRLVEAVPALRVFPQVAVAQVIDLQRFRKDGPSPLAEMSLDFVICHPEDMSILAAIELTADSQSVITQKKRIALDQSGIPLVVLEQHEMPEIIGLRKTLALHVAARRRFEPAKD